MKAAVEHGKLEIVRYFLETFPESCGSSAMDTAAACGHFNIFKYLHMNSRAGCTKGAMNRAAGSGNFNRNEGCTKHAINLAARNGHLKVVKWLHANRSKGCTTRALISAIRNDHWHIMEWLCCNQSFSLNGNQVLEFALEERKLNILSSPYFQKLELSYPTFRFAANRSFSHLAQFMESLDDSVPNKKLAREYLSSFETIFNMYSRYNGL